MVYAIEEQNEDLAMCCICSNSYDEKDHKPKFLICLHTFCLKCIEVSQIQLFIFSTVPLINCFVLHLDFVDKS